MSMAIITFDKKRLIDDTFQMHQKYILDFMKDIVSYESMQNIRDFLKQSLLDKCFCGSTNVVRDGLRWQLQRYKSKTCGGVF